MSRRRFQEGEQRVRATLVSDSELGESPLWPTAAVVSAALLYVTLLLVASSAVFSRSNLK